MKTLKIRHNTHKDKNKEHILALAGQHITNMNPHHQAGVMKFSIIHDFNLFSPSCASLCIHCTYSNVNDAIAAVNLVPATNHQGRLPRAISLQGRCGFHGYRHVCCLVARHCIQKRYHQLCSHLVHWDHARVLSCLQALFLCRSNRQCGSCKLNRSI